MYSYLSFLLIIPLQLCLSQVRPDAANVVPFAPATPPIPSKCADKSVAAAPSLHSNALRFRLPFMDMNIQNERNLHILHAIASQRLFVLHGKELYELFVSGQEKRLSLIGALTGSVRQQEPIAAEIILWRNYLLLVIALEDFLEIYQLPADLLAQNAEAAKLGQVGIDTITKFEPIQQLTLNGRFRKLFLINVGEERVMLLTAVNYTKLQSKLRTYEWSNTFFDMEEDLTLPAIHVLEIVGTPQKFLLSGRLIKHQGRTIIVVYEIDSTDLHLRNRQTLTIPSRTIHAFTFRGRNYLIGCATQQQKCNLFHMKREEAQFSVFRQFSGKDLTFDRFVAGAHFLVGVHQRTVNIYPNSRLDCYASFSANESDITEIIPHVSEQDDSSFVLLNYQRPFHTLLRIVEVEAVGGQRLGAAAAALNDTGAEDLNALQQHHHLFEGTVERLRSLLLQRKSAMDVFRKGAAIMRPKLHRFNASNPVRLHAGNIGIVRILSETLQSPVQLLRRVEALRAPQRSTRSMRQVFPGNGFVLDMPRVAKIQQLHVNNLIYNGSLLPGFYLDNSSKSNLPILSIRSAVRTKVLTTSQLLTRSSTRLSRQNINASGDLPLRVRDLRVKRINDVSVSEFLNSLFLRNRDRKLKGRLVLQGETSVDALWTPLLNDLVVAQLFNLKEPQIVSSRLLINSIATEDVQAELVNGLRFEEDVAFSGSDDIITTPVEIRHMSIAGDLLVSYKPRKEREINDTDSHFQQFYTGKVSIKGSLTVDSLMRNNKMSTAVFVNGLPFSEALLKEIYLLQNTTQTFNTPVKFGNAKVITPKFSTNLLDDHPTTQHLRTTGNSPLESPLLLIFMQAQVDGDLKCKSYKSKLLELATDVVRHGDSVNITGTKIFNAPLTVGHLTTRKLNELAADDFVLKSELLHEINFQGNKSCDKLVVTGKAIIQGSLDSTFVNDERGKMPIQRDYFIKHLYLPHHLQANNIVIRKINGIAFAQIFDRLSVENEQLVLRKDLMVKGNVQFVENLQVDKINNISWPDYINNLVRLNENAIVNGSIHLLQGLTVKNALNTPLLNAEIMEDVFSKVLLRSKPQRITGHYTFGSLGLTNLDVSNINGVPTNIFIDTRAKELTLRSDFIVPKLTVHGDVSGKFVSTFEFAVLKEQLQQLTQRRWRNVVIHGNAYWNDTATRSGSISTKQYEQLQYLYRHAVRRSVNQVISGSVYMTQPLISRLRTRTIFPNGVDLGYIARDCLLKNTTAPQTIVGAKLFYKPLRLQRALVEGPLAITTLNEVDVQRFYASLYRRSSGEPISGPLHFKVPPIIGQLIVNGLVNGMPTSQIYTPARGAMPPIRMHTLVIDEALQIGVINEHSLDYLLRNRIKLNGEPQEVQGFLTFEHLVTNNETLLQSINGVSIDDLIYRKSDQLQVIAGRKVIDGNLIFNGPSRVTRLNGQRLVDAYQQSIFTTFNYHFDNLTIDQGTFVKGLVLISEMPMSATGRTVPTSVANSTEAADAIDEVHLLEENAEQQVGDNVFRKQLNIAVNQLTNLLSSQNTTSLMADEQSAHLLYLDFDLDTQVLKQYANESVNETVLYELQHATSCEHHFLQVQFALHSHRLFITNVTTSFLYANAGAISAKAQNYCGDRFRKVKSKITVNGLNIAKVFGMRKYIEGLELFVGANNHTYLLLHAIDEARNRNKVRVLRIEDALGEVKDWQTIQFGIGKSVRLFKLDNLTVLASAALVGDQQAVSIYHFKPEAAHFKLAQVIDGPFDVMAMVAVQSQHYQLLLSCHNCQYVNVYDLTRASANPYKLFQLIKLPIRVDKLHSFVMSDGERFLLILGEQQQDFYLLYKYASIQGWLHNILGYFRNIELAVPLSGKLMQPNGTDLVLLLCGGGGEMDRCSVLRAITQL